MYQNILIATDLSPASRAVVSCLSGLKDYGAERCLLLQCLRFQDAASAAYSYNPEVGENLLSEQKEILEQQGFDVEARTVVGTPKHEIVRIAREENLDLIVVGAQGHSLMEERALGGVAYGVLNQSTKPILVVPVEKSPDQENACEPVARCHFNDHILYATDFSAMADNAFLHLERLVSQGAKSVTLVHVQDKTRIENHLEDRLEEFNATDQKRMESLKTALLEKGEPQVEIEIPYGLPPEEIAGLIQSSGANLVIMGTQGRGFFREMFLGSVSHNVVRKSVAPVLLIPDQA